VAIHLAVTRAAAALLLVALQLLAVVILVVATLLVVDTAQSQAGQSWMSEEQRKDLLQKNESDTGTYYKLI
jgi:uncharacterized membrane protein YeiB